MQVRVLNRSIVVRLGHTGGVESPPSGWRKSSIHPRRRWPKEVADFVPWLETNIGLLGAALGRDLIVVARERLLRDDTAIRADLIARDAADGGLVLVEAQLGRTDARHLGQLLTYAAAGRFAQLVWVVADMSDLPAVLPDHARALALLDQSLAPSGTRFSIVEATVETDWYPPEAEAEAMELIPRLRLVDLEKAGRPQYHYR